MITTDPLGLIAELRAHGVELSVAGDRLRYRPKSAITPELRSAIAACKQELVQLLTPVRHPMGESDETPLALATQALREAIEVFYPPAVAELVAQYEGLSRCIRALEGQRVAAVGRADMAFVETLDYLLAVEYERLRSLMDQLSDVPLPGRVRPIS